MIKHDELYNPHSCLNKAQPGEWIFALLGRDKQAAKTVRYWCRLRVESGANCWDDSQIMEALQTTDEMKKQAKEFNE